MPAIENPKDLFERLSVDVIDQALSLQQISVALYKHIHRLNIGNLMLIGNSGTGKTTMMRAIERMFAEDPELSQFVNTIRLNANVVSSDESGELESSIVIERLRQNALNIMGDDASEDRFRELIEHGVVFLDEVDKIRSHVGDRTNPRGILAQEALLTLIEGETLALPLTYRNEEGEWVETKVLTDTGRILFICGGAFEGLYDMVYRRVASGEHRDKLIQEFVVAQDEGELHENERFSLQDYLRYEDMFTYGMTPQFLGRFDEIIVLNDLTVSGLMRIFLEPKDSLYRQARRYFRSLDIDLQITKEGLRFLAERAFENHRIGARALRSVFKRVMRGIEYDGRDSYLVQKKDGKAVLVLTKDLIANSS